MKRASILWIFMAILCFCQLDPLHAQNNEIREKIDEYIGAFVEMNQFSGSILVAKDGQLLINKAYGYASYEFGIKNTPEVKFRTGSLTKGFTAIAIMQLVETNQLSLDDRLSEYIPDYPRGNEIIIKHLLTHTSGIPNHTEFDDFNKERRVFHYDILETIKTFQNKPLEFNPGDKFSYSNSNYILLGFIIEQVSNMKYAEYIKENVFKPLKMRNSGYEKPEEIIKNMARGYRLQNDEIINARYRNMSNAHASGALYSTTGDLYKFDRALYTNELISEESRELMFTPFKGNYGFGWGIVHVFDRRMIAHSGEIDGSRSNISRFPGENVCIIILSNFEHTPINRINKDIIAIVFGKEYRIPEVVNTVQLPGKVLQSYTGKYEVRPGLVFEVTYSDGELFCQPTGQPKLELLSVSETEFTLMKVDAKISFVKGANEKVERLILYQGGKQISAFKIK